MHVPVSALRWTYDLPWWRGADRRWFQVVPRGYLDTPHDYPMPYVPIMIDLAIRDASPDDLPAIESIHVRGWQQGYRDLFPASYLDALRVEPGLHRRQREWQKPHPPNRHAVAVHNGQVVGFTFIGTAQPDSSETEHGHDFGGELYAIYVDPDRWGCGTGKRLLTDAIDYLTGVGLTPIVLWVLSGNARARRIYEAMGFRDDDVTKPFVRERRGRRIESTETRYTLMTSS